MGLDMYLTRHHNVKNWEFQKSDGHSVVTATIGGKPLPLLNPERVSRIVEDVAYWRKANQIHAWFVKHVQDGRDECHESWVPREAFAKLQSDLQYALDHQAQINAGYPNIYNPLEPQGGFFFGSTSIDEYYWREIEETKKVVDDILSHPNTGRVEYFYRASW